MLWAGGQISRMELSEISDGVVGEQERPRTRQFSVGWEANPPGEHLLPLLEYILFFNTYILVLEYI